MKIYRITGSFMMGETYQEFTKEIIGKGKIEALERLYSDLGSKHKVKRRNIKLKKMTEIKIDKVENPLVKYQAGAKDAK